MCSLKFPKQFFYGLVLFFAVFFLSFTPPTFGQSKNNEKGEPKTEKSSQQDEKVEKKSDPRPKSPLKKRKRKKIPQTEDAIPSNQIPPEYDWFSTPITPLQFSPEKNQNSGAKPPVKSEEIQSINNQKIDNSDISNSPSTENTPSESISYKDLASRALARLMATKEKRIEQAQKHGFVLPSMGKLKENLPAPVEPTPPTSEVSPSIPAQEPPQREAVMEIPIERTPLEKARPAPSRSSKANPWDFNVQGWNSGTGGHLTNRGLDINLRQGVDFKKETAMIAGLRYSFNPRNQVRLSYSGFSQTGRLLQPATFDHLSYASPATMKRTSNLWDLGGTYRFHHSQHGYWGALYGLKSVKSHTILEQWMTAGRRAGTMDSRFTAPYLGFSAEAKISANLRLNGSFKVGSAGSEGYLTDSEVNLAWGKSAKTKERAEWFGTLGYRHFDFKGETSGDSIGLRYSGPTFGLWVKF